MAKSKNIQKKRFRPRPAPPLTSLPASFSQEQNRGGLLVTAELQKALEECKSRVAEIAADCRRRNRKFRDIEFDLEYDAERCLTGLEKSSLYDPSDVQRATQIFQKPSFFIDGADSKDIVQGELGDCWFLSALATMSTCKELKLVEKSCVAYDEQVGVYGFIFFRDTAWVTVIIDDLLFTSIPKFEELSAAEKQLYHHDKKVYNKSARKSGKSLCFAKSGTPGETWVPLIEKAYAKLHGNYASLDGGEAGEAMEDLTGGVSSLIYTKDILDPYAFWTDELLRANTDRLFGCAFAGLDPARSGVANAKVDGLIGGHAYAVLRAKEYNGKRFVVIRNPWGRGEWTGPWSDGSKEWTSEWLPALQALEHTFGDDGEFVMEYKDFLENWEQIDRTLLFDSSWTMSSQWLKVIAPPVPSPWAYGDVSFTISLQAASSTIIVLSKLDDRYWKAISSTIRWSFDFILYKKGDSKPITTSSASICPSRSVNAEVYLEAGEYVVHVRLDPWEEEEQIRTKTRLLTERAKGRSIVSNFNATQEAKYLPVPLDLLAGQDLSELETKIAELNLSEKKTQLSNVDETEIEQEAKQPASESANDPSAGANCSLARDGEEGVAEEGIAEEEIAEERGLHGKQNFHEDTQDEEGTDERNEKKEGQKDEENVGEGEGSDLDDIDIDDDDDDYDVYLGLRVYTNKAAAAKVGGQLRRTSEPLVSIASKLAKNNQYAETM